MFFHQKCIKRRNRKAVKVGESTSTVNPLSILWRSICGPFDNFQQVL